MLKLLLHHLLDSENAAWSGDGCSVRQRGPNYTVCQCNHLTSFAIVMNPEGAETVKSYESLHSMHCVLCSPLIITYGPHLK